MLKGRMLERLSGEITSAKILPLINLSYEGFCENWEKALEEIQKLGQGHNVIIRSSSSLEDNDQTSNAGAFLSLSDVNSNNADALKDAIKNVFLSYRKDLENNDEVLIQPMLPDIEKCGVAFTADQDTLAPYYIINYDFSGKFDGVTSGTSDNLITYVQYKNSDHSAPEKFLDKVVELSRELESCLQIKYLDIEFAFTKNNQAYLLQVRPLVLNSKRDLSSLNYDLCLSRIFKKIQKINANHPNLIGKKSYLGVMPDWNPAEIIGLRPKMLSLSLYKELITDSVWAFQRHNYGYRNLRSHPLMLSLMGVPYIDLRTTFNSFIPEKLPDAIASKLCNYYLDRLSENPKRHDKIEFDIVLSCYHFSLQKDIESLKNHGFSYDEIKQIESSILAITNNVLNLEDGLFVQDLKKIETLKAFEKETLLSDLPLIDKIYWLIEYTKRYGTLPFAGVARAGFIAIQFCQSFVDEGIISPKEREIFFNSLSTVSKELSNSLNDVMNGKLSEQEFLKSFGHLRPGTYDITTLRYDESFDQYFSSSKHVENSNDTKFEFSKHQIEKIDTLIRRDKIESNANDLIKFIKMSIEGREYTKFVFSHTVSECLKLLQTLGQKFKISIEDLAHLDIKLILDAYSNLAMDGLGEVMQDAIDKNKSSYRYTEGLRLPSLITKPESVYSFYIEKDEPNYVTLKNVTAQIRTETNGFGDVEGKIVFIQSADPGYDFLFSKNIAGLVTQFGGGNSHMAIRCAELGIPAVIGAGEKLFAFWANKKVITIDCSSKQVHVIS